MKFEILKGTFRQIFKCPATYSHRFFNVLTLTTTTHLHLLTHIYSLTLAHLHSFKSLHISLSHKDETIETCEGPAPESLWRLKDPPLWRQCMVIGEGLV